MDIARVEQINLTEKEVLTIIAVFQELRDRSGLYDDEQKLLDTFIEMEKMLAEDGR